MKNLILVVILTLFVSHAHSQRHYKGIAAMEVNAGNNFTGDFNPFFNIGYSKYLNNSSYYKVGGNFMKTTCDDNSPGRGAIMKQWFINGNYFRTVYTNNSNFFFSIGPGAFLGSEQWFGSEKIMAGVMIGLEVEYFFTNRYALTLSGQEYWSVLSDVRQFNTVFAIGFKYLLH